MKKILITTAVCLIGATSMMAQGRVNFSNGSAAPIRINNGTISADGVVTPGVTTQVLGTASTATFGIGPGSAQVRLFAGLTASSATNAVLIGTAANAAFVLNTASSIASAQGSFPGGTTLPLSFDGYSGTGPVFLQFTATATGYRGISSIINVTPTLSPTAATVLFAANPTANQWNGITMYAVPEPSSMVLAGLGAASLLAFRRRS